MINCIYIAYITENVTERLKDMNSQVNNVLLLIISNNIEFYIN